MTKDELSLLLYLETRAVDYAGRINMVHLNDQDRGTLDKWSTSKFVLSGRIQMADHNKDGTNWCLLSPEAFDAAHAERITRAQRMWKSRVYKRTGE